MKHLLAGLLILCLTSCVGSQMRSNVELTTSGSMHEGTDMYRIGSVDTAFQLLGSDHAIVVEAVPDPDISGITCFWSRAEKGGIL